MCPRSHFVLHSLPAGLAEAAAPPLPLGSHRCSPLPFGPGSSLPLASPALQETPPSQPASFPFRASRSSPAVPGANYPELLPPPAPAQLSSVLSPRTVDTASEEGCGALHPLPTRSFPSPDSAASFSPTFQSPEHLGGWSSDSHCFPLPTARWPRVLPLPLPAGQILLGLQLPHRKTRPRLLFERLSAFTISPLSFGPLSNAFLHLHLLPLN